MDAWIAAILLVFTVAGLWLLFSRVHRQGMSKLYRIGIICLAALSVLLAVYLVLTLLFVNAVP